MIQSFGNLSLQNWEGAIIAIIPALFNCYILYRIRSRLPKNIVSGFFGILTLSLIFWQLNDAFDRLSVTPTTAGLWDGVFSFGWIFVGPLLLHFSLFYTRKSKLARTPLVVALLYLPMFVLLNFYEREAMHRVYINSGFWGWVSDPAQSDDFRIIALLTSAMAFVSLVILAEFAYRMRRHRIMKYQSLLIAVGFAIPIVQGIITEFIFPILRLRNELPITSTIMSTVPIATLIAFKRYNLFSIAEAIDPYKISDITCTFLFTVSPQSKISYVNAFTAKALNIPPSRNHDLPLGVLFGNHEEEISRFQTLVIEPAFKKQTVLNHQFEFFDPNGKAIPVLVAANPVFDNRVLLGVLVTAREYSDLKEAQLLVESSEKRFRALIEKSKEAFVLSTSDGVVRYASPHAFEITGYQPEELAGTRLIDLVYPEDRYAIEFIFDEVSKTPGLNRDYSCRFIKKNGSVIWIEGSRNNLLHNPSVQAIVGNFREVTEQKLADKKLKDQNKELTMINAELDQLVYSVTHDLHAPLMSVMGLIEALGEEYENPGAAQYIGYMKQSIARMDCLIREILDYNRNRRHQVDEEPIVLRHLISEIIENMRFIDSASNFNFVVDVPPDLIIESDPFRLKVIFNNLISNAIKYCKEKSDQPFLRIDYQRNGHYHMTKFTDNGIGIDERHIPNIFKMFYRASEQSNGSGLGLYLTREAVNRLGGKVEAESEPGVGSTFTVHIPIK